MSEIVALLDKTKSSAARKPGEPPKKFKVLELRFPPPPGACWKTTSANTGVAMPTVNRSAAPAMPRTRVTRLKISPYSVNSLSLKLIPERQMRNISYSKCKAHRHPLASFTLSLSKRLPCNRLNNGYARWPVPADASRSKARTTLYAYTSSVRIGWWIQSIRDRPKVLFRPTTDRPTLSA